MTTDDAGSDGALAGVKVIDLTINVLGPMATLTLGDMGADVVKVESPEGDPTRRLGAHRTPGMAAHFVNFNRNKRSAVLDLKTDDGREQLLRLVDTADVFVHNMRADAAERLGIDPETIRKRNPGIIYASGSGYGRTGSRSNDPAFDDVIQGESGLAAMFAKTQGTPAFVPYAMVDKLCGVYLASGILGALFHRQRTGEGQIVHVPMYETMVVFNLLDQMWQATFSGKGEDLGYPRTLTPHRRPYETQDGYICLLAVTDPQWSRLFEAIERPDLAADPRFNNLGSRTHNSDPLNIELAAELAKRTTEEWNRRLTAADIPHGPVNDLLDLAADPYLEEAGVFEHYQHPADGAHMTLRCPLDLSATPTRMRRPAPLLGEHTDAVRAELDAAAKDGTAP